MTSASTPDVAAYLESWGLELAARQNRVRQLIGDAHWLSDGHHKEAILREFLSRYLPRDVECSTGFVRRSTGEKRCSPEIDIMLFSSKLHLPYFAEGGINIVDPASLLATIEVKSRFAIDPLKDALKNIQATRGLVVGTKPSPKDLWSGLFFYDLPSSRTLDSALDTLTDCLKELLAPAADVGNYPTCIVLGQNCLVFPESDGANVRLRAFEGKGAAFASAICDLLASISSQNDGPKLSGFEDWGAGAEYRLVERKF